MIINILKFYHVMKIMKVNLWVIFIDWIQPLVKKYFTPLTFLLFF